MRSGDELGNVEHVPAEEARELSRINSAIEQEEVDASEIAKPEVAGYYFLTVAVDSLALSQYYISSRSRFRIDLTHLRTLG